MISCRTGTVGVNVQIPVFNGFLYSAKAKETELQAQAVKERALDLRNRISRDFRTQLGRWMSSVPSNRLFISLSRQGVTTRAIPTFEARTSLGTSSSVRIETDSVRQMQ
jgi:outer membrane protein